MENKAFLDAILGLVSIESIARVDVTPEAPYGKGPAKALDYVMKLCETLGIRTVNLGGKVAWAEIGQGEEIVAAAGPTTPAASFAATGSTAGAWPTTRGPRWQPSLP